MSETPEYIVVHESKCEWTERNEKTLITTFRIDSCLTGGGAVEITTLFEFGRDGVIECITTKQDTSDNKLGIDAYMAVMDAHSHAIRSQLIFWENKFHIFAKGKS